MPSIAVLERKQDPIQRKRLVKFVVRKTVSAHTWGLLFERLKVTISRSHIFYPLWQYLIMVSTDCIYRDKNSWRTSSNDCLFLLQCKEAIMCQSRSPCSFILSYWYYLLLVRLVYPILIWLPVETGVPECWLLFSDIWSSVITWCRKVLLSSCSGRRGWVSKFDVTWIRCERGHFGCL